MLFFISHSISLGTIVSIFFKMKKFEFFVSILVMLMLSACSHERLKIDVTDVLIPEVKVERLEQDVFKMDVSNITEATKKLETKYGHFYSSYFSVLLNNGGIKDSSYAYRIKQFINDPTMAEVYANCQKEFPNTDKIKEDISEAFKHYKHYFPDKKLPKVVTMITGFNYPVVAIDSTIGIGIEMYLGSNSKYYKMLSWPHYKTMFMNKEAILPDAVRTWMGSEFQYNMSTNDFISEIIYMGKILFLSDALLPNTPDSLKIHYSNPQLQYCKQNEFNIWSYFAAKKLLYTTDQSEIIKFTSEGPFTSALSKEAPPFIGYWVGWQIVRKYMQHNPDVTVEQLIKESDAQKILLKANYKPLK